MTLVAGSAATAADITQAVAQSGNFLINGGFDFAQGYNPAVFSTLTTNTYSADRWKVAIASASLQYIRENVSGVSGVNTKYCGTYKQITNTGKFVVFQPIENLNSVHLRGKTCTFQMKGSVSAAATVRMAILQGSATGTADVIPSTFVTAFGGVGTDPTWGTQIAIIGTATSFALGTAFTQMNLIGTIPANSNNVIVAIWTNALAAVNWTISLTEANLHPGAEVYPWIPRLYEQEMQLCKRHYEKSYPIDQQPGAVVTGVFRPTFIACNADYAIGCNNFSVEKMGTPTVAVYSISGTAAAVNELITGTQIAGVTVFSEKQGIMYINKTGGFSTGSAYAFHFTAQSEL
jgi:hypothetical protein